MNKITTDKQQTISELKETVICALILIGYVFWLIIYISGSMPEPIVACTLLLIGVIMVACIIPIIGVVIVLLGEAMMKLGEVILSLYTR